MASASSMSGKSTEPGFKPSPLKFFPLCWCVYSLCQFAGFRFFNSTECAYYRLVHKLLFLLSGSVLQVSFSEWRFGAAVSLECVNACKLWRGDGSGKFDCSLLSCAWKAPRFLTGFLASTAHPPHQCSDLYNGRNGRRNRYNFVSFYVSLGLSKFECFQFFNWIRDAGSWYENDWLIIFLLFWPLLHPVSQYG